MKFWITFLSLITFAAAVPQGRQGPCGDGTRPSCSCQCPNGKTFVPKQGNPQDIRSKIRNAIRGGGGIQSAVANGLNSNENPCGSTSRPSCTCTCPNTGETFNPRNNIQSLLQGRFQ